MIDELVSDDNVRHFLSQTLFAAWWQTTATEKSCSHFNLVYPIQVEGLHFISCTKTVGKAEIQ